VLLKQRHDGKVQASRDGWFVDYNDAMSYFDLIRCNSVQNDQRYCNPQVDKIVDEANQQLDDAKRTELLTKAHDTAMNDYPMVPLFQYSAVRLVKPYVGGYTSTNYVDQRATQDMYLIKH
jgi:oligopeptide transport system substrate-binding protein